MNDIEGSTENDTTSWKEIRVTDETLSPGVIQFLRTVACAMDAGDPFTHGRPYRCSKYAARLGRHFGMSKEQVVQLECAALLQDLGKKVILSGLLQKPGRFDEAERKQVQTHSHACFDILQQVPFLEQSAALVLAQHERPDGLGYPHGIPAEQIPLGSRILSVVSAFDAMTCDRPYRQGLEAEAAYQEMRDCAGTMFFADVVEALIELHQSEEIFEEFELNELSTYLGEDASSCRALRDWLQREGVACGDRDTGFRPLIDAASDAELPSAETLGATRSRSSEIVLEGDPFSDHAA